MTYIYIYRIIISITIADEHFFSKTKKKKSFFFFIMRKNRNIVANYVYILKEKKYVYYCDARVSSFDEIQELIIFNPCEYCAHSVVIQRYCFYSLEFLLLYYIGEKSIQVCTRCRQLLGNIYIYI